MKFQQDIMSTNCPLPLTWKQKNKTKTQLNVQVDEEADN